ncbi:MAG: hypothetical protein RIM99_10690 [Cyclobacteriaceae bacterium]
MRGLFSLILLMLLGCSTEYVIPNHYPGVIKIKDNLLFTAYGEGGLFITDIETDQVVAHIIPQGEMKGIDDFSIDGDLLFVLDARSQDYFASYSISLVESPVLLDGPIAVQGGPYNGISARGGNIVVSGGSGFLEYFQYSADGKLTGSATFGRDRGHPDVILSNTGAVAFVSTDFSTRVNGSRFGMISLLLGATLNVPGVISQHPIPEAGFTLGINSPVGFPIQADIYNNHLLVAHGGGMTIIELIDEAAFGETSLFNPGIEAVSVIAENNIAYIIGYSNSNPVLIKADITDILNPITLETVALDINDDIPTSVALSSQHIFVAAGKSGIVKLIK